MKLDKKIVYEIINDFSEWKKSRPKRQGSITADEIEDDATENPIYKKFSKRIYELDNEQRAELIAIMETGRGFAYFDDAKRVALNRNDPPEVVIRDLFFNQDLDKYLEKGLQELSK